MYKFDTELALRQLKESSTKCKNDIMIMYVATHNNLNKSLKDLDKEKTT